MTPALAFAGKEASCRAFARKVPAARAIILILLLVVITAAVCPSPHAELSLRPFAPDSPFNTRIPEGAAVDLNSKAMIAWASRTGGIDATMVEFGIPIYQAAPDAPRYTVQCTKRWGQCPFDGHQVPIPTGAKPHTGSDGAMVVVDDSTREVFEFWQARHVGNGWTSSWGAVTNLDGSGWDRGATGSGASRLAGVVRIAEIQQGEIPHALAVATDNVCANVFRPPAIGTDGTSSRSDCIPEGARIRLDPTVDLNTLTLAPAVRTVARAMQVYGAYVVDSGGAAVSVSFELDPTAGNGSIGSVYQQAGLRWDYDDLPGVPWDRLQVLA